MCVTFLGKSKITSLANLFIFFLKIIKQKVIKFAAAWMSVKRGIYKNIHTKFEKVFS